MLARAPSLTLRIEPKAAHLYDRGAHQYYPLSRAEAALLAAAQRSPLSRALASVAARFGDDEARRAVEGLAQFGPTDRVLGAPVREVRLAPVPGARGAPLVVHLGLTAACNFACAHCYSSSGRRARDELSTREVLALVDALAAMGCCKLVLGGGEPFLRKDLAQVVAHADDRGVDCFVHTNGALLTPQTLSALARRPPAGLAVSLDGADARSNDAVRGPGAFARAARGLRALRDHYPPGFNVSVAVGPRNASQAPRLVELARRIGAGVLLLRPTYPAGEALGAEDLACDRPTFARARRAALARGRKLGVAVDAPAPVRPVPPDFEGFGCVAGRLVLGIDPSGNVTPCLNLPARFSAGNVRGRPLLEIWRNGGSFRALRRQRPGASCASCPDYGTCRGGCRVRALASGAGLAGPDSWCHR